MATRVLLLTQWFDPEPTFKGFLFARELVSRGFDVEVVTGFPNYPGGKLYPGYRLRWLQRESLDGVAVTRVPLYPSHDQSAIGRVLNYISFSASALVYCLFMAQRPAVVYAYHPPLTVGITAMVLRLFRRVPVVYDIQDIWPDTLQATGMISNRFVLSIVERLCRLVYAHMDRLVVLSPGFKRLLITRGVDATRIDVVYNWCDEKALATSGADHPRPFPDDGCFRIVFAGNMGKAQALDVVLDAAVLLRESAPLVTFVLLGGGVETSRLRQRARDMQLDNVEFMAQVPMAEVGAILAGADALLVHLRKDPLFEITIPSKTQAYMAVGKPVLMAVDGDAASLILASGGGVVAESGNPHSMALAAKGLASASVTERMAMGESGRKYYLRNLSVQAGVNQFAGIFERLAGISGDDK
jgi:glycosyltransferase involved in cell wall biosynthesis